MAPPRRKSQLGHRVAPPALELAARVHAGELSPEEAVRTSLERIRAVDGGIGAFQRVRHEAALREARELARRDDLDRLPLAGVPVAAKDNLEVAGEPTRAGSPATPEAPAAVDHPTVRAVRRAGGVVVGKTRVPELCAWPDTDGLLGTTRNPWHPRRTPGGSSGGSAAAVAAAMVPVALGSDGLGSIRIPAACCGVFGVKPGAGLLPVGEEEAWFGMTEHGPLATTVEDAALLLSVLAHRPALREVAPPERPLRICLSLDAPAPGVAVDEAWARAAAETAKTLAGEGHEVEEGDPPLPLRFVVSILARWAGAAAREVEVLDAALLDARTRRHARVGGLARRLGLTRTGGREALRQRLEGFFRRFDVLLTPTLARPPLEASGWRERGWFRNVTAGVSFSPFTAAWNLAGYPAAAVPAGFHPDGTPLSVQLVAPAGAESRLLSLALQIQRLRPWPRHAPEGEEEEG